MTFGTGTHYMLVSPVCLCKCLDKDLAQEPQNINGDCGDGGGFFWACEDLGRMFNHLFPACGLFCFLLGGGGC